MERLRDELLARFGSHRVLVTIDLKDHKDKYAKVIKALKLSGKNRKTVKVWVPFELPPLPQKGDFNVQQVRDSTYFFH